MDVTHFGILVVAILVFLQPADERDESVACLLVQLNVTFLDDWNVKMYRIHSNTLWNGLKFKDGNTDNILKQVHGYLNAHCATDKHSVVIDRSLATPKTYPALSSTLLLIKLAYLWTIQQK